MEVGYGQAITCEVTEGRKSHFGRLSDLLLLLLLLLLHCLSTYLISVLPIRRQTQGTVYNCIEKKIN